MKEVFNKKKGSNYPTLEVEDKCITDSEEKANNFNDYFAKKSKLEEAGRIPDTSDLEEANSNIDNIRVSHLTVKRILQNMKVAKASGPDGISPRILKNVAEEIAPVLARIFNFSLQTGKFPSIWKQANVTPLYKNKGKRSKLNNYRPVSLLSCIGKAMERCVYDVLFKYLIEEKLLTKYQAAYLPNSSTETQVLEIYHHILDALDKGKDIRFLFLDISAAFDKVWHKGLLAKLEKYGIKGRLYKWIENYLQNRTQRVVIEGKTSKPTMLNSGVPQGSILGPLLFLIYINDLPAKIETNIRVYADDSSLYINYAKNKEGEGAQALQEDIHRIEEWAEKWLITFNPTKTESLVFSRKREVATPALNMLDTNIEEVKEHKHLGVTLQQNGTWKSHIVDICAKAKRKVDVLRSLMYRLNRKSLEKLYLSYIRPSLEYGCTIWDNCNDYEKEELEKIQLAGLRVITGGKRGTSHELLYSDTGIETLQERRDRRKLVMMFKIQKGKAPETLIELLPETTEKRTERHLRTKGNTTLIMAHSEAFHGSFIPQMIRKWNNLPQQTREVATVEQFKLKINPVKKKIPIYIYAGERKLQVLHTRIRLRKSDLKEELFEVGLAESPMCECGNGIEDADHFFKECQRHNEARQHIENTLGIYFRNYQTEDILEGETAGTDEDNLWLFHAAQKYIERTKRFL